MISSKNQPQEELPKHSSYVIILLNVLVFFMDEQQPINFLKPQNYPPNEEKKSPLKKIVFSLVLIIIIVFLATRNSGTAKWPDSAASYDPVTLKPKKIGLLESVKNVIFGSDNVVSGQQDDRINILLLGIGGSGHDGPYLSDTNIILSVKPSANQVAMISIPRDLGVKIDEHGIRKINNADAFGEAQQIGYGGEYARKIFEKTFEIDTPYYVRVDFKAFKELVDIVGGVDVKVERDFTDYSYPEPNFSYQTVSFKAGLQTMDGERVLVFARSRHGTNGEGSDFARAKRQQMVLSALKDKLLSPGVYLNPIKIQKILGSLSQNISTNLDFGQIMYLAGLGKQLDGEIKHLVLDDNPKTGYLKSLLTEDGAYLLTPKTGDFNEINATIKNIFESTSTPSAMIAENESRNKPPAATPVSEKIEVQNGTWRLGLASKTKQTLETKEFYVLAIGNAVKKPVPDTTIYLLNPNAPKELVEKLKTALGAPVGDFLPDWLSEEYDNPDTTANEYGPKYNSDSDILVILGENYSY